MIFKILILIGLLKLLEITEKPFLCAGIYGAFVFAFSMMLGTGLLTAFIVTAISTVLASIYFWLLDYYHQGLPYWGILVVGLFIGLV